MAQRPELPRRCVKTGGRLDAQEDEEIGVGHDVPHHTCLTHMWSNVLLPRQLMSVQHSSSTEVEAEGVEAEGMNVSAAIRQTGTRGYLLPWLSSCNTLSSFVSSTCVQRATLQVRLSRHASPALMLCYVMLCYVRLCVHLCMHACIHAMHVMHVP